LLIDPHGAVGPPTSGKFADGELIVDSEGDLWVCTFGGLGTKATWQNLSAGGFRPIKPVRIYDTRPGFAPESNGDVKLAHGQEVTLEGIGLTVIPHTATGLALNIIAQDSTGPGFMSLYPASEHYDLVTTPPTSNINYSAGAVVANSATVLLAVSGPDAGKFRAFNFGTPANLIIDVAGYYT
jgi:hypothetical protein